MGRENQLGIVTTVRNEEMVALQSDIVKRIFDSIPSEYDPTLYLSMSDASQQTLDMVTEIARNKPNIVVTNTDVSKGLAYAYLAGLKKSAEDNNNKNVEIDLSGSHNPKDIPRFLENLDNNQAVFSTRFGQGGKTVGYPLQRRILSAGGTLLSNTILGIGQFVNDLTSGYEAFRKNVLDDIFSKYPIEKWISVVNGPGHFYQTEIRTKVIWGGHSFKMIPIVYDGKARFVEPYELPQKDVLQAFKSLLLLRQSKDK